MIEDSYALLNLKPSASISEVKKAYKLLLKKYHPDLNPSSMDSEKIYKIISAYDNIINYSELNKVHNEKSFLDILNIYFPNDYKIYSKKSFYSLIDLFITIFFKSFKHSKISLNDYNTYLPLFQLILFIFFLSCFVFTTSTYFIIPLLFLFLDIFSRSIDKLFNFNQIIKLNHIIYDDLTKFMTLINSSSHKQLKYLSHKINTTLYKRSQLLIYRGLFNTLFELLLILKQRIRKN